ncbi:hypothetical protein ACT7V1_001063 [Salmonella enterica subsp. enterica]
MNINYSSYDTFFMMISEFMMTAFVIVILSVVVFAYNKAFKSALTIKMFAFSQLLAIVITLVTVTAKRTNVGSIQIVWNDGIHQFYTHFILGLVFTFLILFFVFWGSIKKGNKDDLKDCKNHLLPCVTGSLFVLIIFFFSASPFRHEEKLITDARILAADPTPTTIIHADGFYWLFDMDRSEFDKPISREIVRGKYNLLCSSDELATCWAGKKFPKNTPLDKVL